MTLPKKIRPIPQGTNDPQPVQIPPKTLTPWQARLIEEKQNQNNPDNEPGLQ